MEATSRDAGKRFGGVRQAAFFAVISVFMISILAQCAPVLASVVGGQVGASANPGGTAPPATNHAPPAPALLSPTNGSSTDATAVTFRWNAVNDQDGNVVSYRLDVDTRSDFSARYSVMGNDATEIMPLNNNTRYYWRVGAYDGKVFNFSDTWQFSIGFHTTPPATNQTNGTNSTNTTVTPLTAPALTAPANAAEINASPTLSWSAVNGSAGYELLAWKSGNTTMAINATSSSASYSTASKNLTEGTYSWKVRALGSVPAATSAWSSEWSFKLNFSSATAQNQTQPPAPRCGDGTCNSGESCSSCSSDCGQCPSSSSSSSGGGGGGGGGGSSASTIRTNTTSTNQSASNASNAFSGGSDSASSIIILEGTNDTQAAQGGNDTGTNETVNAGSEAAGTQMTGLAGAVAAYGPYAAGALALIAVLYIFFTKFGISWS